MWNGLPQGSIGERFERMGGAAAVLGFEDLSSKPSFSDARALLVTQESIDIPSLAQGAPVDGYVFGVGAGAIYAMALLRQKQREVALANGELATESLLGTLACDREPEVVLAARVNHAMMHDGQDFEAYHKEITNPLAFMSYALRVILQETNPIVENRLLLVDYVQLARDVRDNLYLPKSGYVDDHNFGWGQLAVAGVIREAWPTLKPLADAGGMGAILADFYHPAVHEVIRRMPAFGERTNLVYASTLLNYVGRPSRPMMTGESSAQYQWEGFRERVRSLDSARATFVLAVMNKRNARQELRALQGPLPEKRPPALSSAGY